MASEADRSLPQSVQRERRQENEVTELGKALREKCIEILSSHGELNRHFLQAVVVKSFPSAHDITFSELRRSWHVGEDVPIDGGMSLEVQIESLGNSSPGEANHILIYVPTLLMGEKKVVLRIGGDGRSDLRMLGDGLKSLGAPSVGKMEEYFQAAMFLKDHLKNTSSPTK